MAMVGWKQIPNTGASHVEWGQFSASAVLINGTVYLYTVESRSGQVYFTSSVDGEHWSQWSPVRLGRDTRAPALGFNSVCATPEGTLYGNGGNDRIWINAHPMGNDAWQLVQPVFTTYGAAEDGAGSGVCPCPSPSGSSTPVCVGEAGDIQYLIRDPCRRPRPLRGLNSEEAERRRPPLPQRLSPVSMMAPFYS
jgi:hypothetical protein